MWFVHLCGCVLLIRLVSFVVIVVCCCWLFFSVDMRCLLFVRVVCCFLLFVDSLFVDVLFNIGGLFIFVFCVLLIILIPFVVICVCRCWLFCPVA